MKKKTIKIILEAAKYIIGLILGYLGGTAI